MPAAYVIVEMQISDMERFKQYMADAPATVKAAGGEYVLRGGRFESLEGEWTPGRVAMLKFPSYEAAKAWYDGETYRAARRKHLGNTEFFNMILVEGVSPSPTRGCKKFCVNGFLAGNCCLAWSNDDRRHETLTHRAD